MKEPGDSAQDMGTLPALLCGQERPRSGQSDPVRYHVRSIRPKLSATNTEEARRNPQVDAVMIRRIMAALMDVE